MANTSYLRYEVEPWVREQLEARYGQLFEPKVLQLAPGGRHEFDAVSADGTIVASIKASSGLTSGRKHPTAKVATCLNEVYFLTLVDADVRLVVLTNPNFHSIFERAMAGKIAAGVKVELLALPAEMQAQVDRVTRRASDEMTRGAVMSAAAVEAEEAGERGENVGE